MDTYRARPTTTARLDSQTGLGGEGSQSPRAPLPPPQQQAQVQVQVHGRPAEPVISEAPAPILTLVAALLQPVLTVAVFLIATLMFTGELRRPMWLHRPCKPTAGAYRRV